MLSFILHNNGFKNFNFICNFSKSCAKHTLIIMGPNDFGTTFLKGCLAPPFLKVELTLAPPFLKVENYPNQNHHC